MRRRARMAAWLLVLAVLPGCAGPPSEEAKVRALIERYNTLLSEGYRTLDMDRMREVAAQLQAEDEYIHMSSLAEGGVRLDPELREIEFVRVSVEETSALVETRETWDYRHYARSTGQIVLEQKALVYHLAWDLSKETSTGAWFVTDVRAISATSAVEPEQLGTLTPVPQGRP